MVRILTQETGPFALDQPLNAVYAQLPGRTILLNFAHYRCWEHQYFKFVINPETSCSNIDLIFTQGLGHAVGLGHFNEANSIMNAVIHVMQRLEADIDLAAGRVMRSVQGDKPGVFEFTRDNGVPVE
ncbi:hypothetical protein XH88_17420 [Bradyrhizobium sp. CCBAU 51627]|nr:hypothetical protein [Bradyrhizobium sp. CCBAU 51627]